MESEGCVYLKNGLDRYLAKRSKSCYCNFSISSWYATLSDISVCVAVAFWFEFNMQALKFVKYISTCILGLPVSREVFERSPTTSTSTSNASTISSLSDDESPVFRRTQKITFVDLQTVASSSVRYCTHFVKHSISIYVCKSSRFYCFEYDSLSCLICFI